jgi:hypothetical protein
MPSFQEASTRLQSDPPVTGTVEMTSNASTILAINGTFVGFSLLVVLARVYVRIIMLKTFGVDDYIIVAAMVTQIFIPIASTLKTNWVPGVWGRRACVLHRGNASWSWHAHPDNFTF